MGDREVRGIMATPLLHAALAAGHLAASLSYITMGAECAVDDLRRLECLGGDLLGLFQYNVYGLDATLGFLNVLAIRGATEQVHFLLLRNADPNVTMFFPEGSIENLSQRGGHGSSALVGACGFGHVSVAKLLLKARADPELANGLGTTPLH